RKTFSLVYCLRTRDWFPCWGKNIRTGFFAEAWQICNVISVSMRKKNQLDIQLVAIRKVHHFLRISACIKGRRHASGWVPYEIGIDSHPAIIRVELRDAVSFINFLWMPLALGKFTKRSRSKTKNARNA